MSTPQPVWYKPNSTAIVLPKIPQSSSLTGGAAAGPGINGYVFDIEDDYSIQLSADITDHYVEDNSAVQDHMAIRPAIITLKGFVGELVDRRQNNFSPRVQNYVQKLSSINQIIPAMLPGATYARNKISQALSISDLINNSISTSKNYYEFSQNLNIAKDRQGEAFGYFFDWMSEKVLCDVETPFGHFSDMCIETVIAKQTGESKYISDFSITLKKMRFVDLEMVPFDPKSFQEKAGIQRASQTDNGKAQGVPVPDTDKSLLFRAGEFTKSGRLPGLMS